MAWEKWKERVSERDNIDDDRTINLVKRIFIGTKDMLESERKEQEFSTTRVLNVALAIFYIDLLSTWWLNQKVLQSLKNEKSDIERIILSSTNISKLKRAVAREIDFRRTQIYYLPLKDRGQYLNIYGITIGNTFLTQTQDFLDWKRRTVEPIVAQIWEPIRENTILAQPVQVAVTFFWSMVNALTPKTEINTLSPPKVSPKRHRSSRKKT